MTHDDNAPCSTACCSSAASAGAAFLTHSLSLRRARCCRAEAGEQWEVSMSSSIPPLPAKQCWRSETTAPYDLRSSSPAHLNHCVVILIHTRSLSLTSPTPLPSMFCLHPRALSFPCVCYPHLPLPATPTPSSPFLPLSMPAALSRRAYHTQLMHTESVLQIPQSLAVMIQRMSLPPSKQGERSTAAGTEQQRWQQGRCADMHGLPLACHLSLSPPTGRLPASERGGHRRQQKGSSANL